MFPFKESKISESIYDREFSENTDSDEFIWHRDGEDRIVQVIKSNGTWEFQQDDKLPKPLNTGDSFNIKKEVWHRVIKGTGTLCVRIQKLS
jgi:quercetin dioxygenase-like cupin family protein